MENYGGQAVIEGVMIKGPKGIVTAVRDSNQEIKYQSKEFVSFTKKYPKTNIPLLRGVINLIETLSIGMKSLNYSVNVAGGEIGQKGSVLISIITGTLSIALALFLFKFLPLGIVQGISNYIVQINNPFIYNIIEGIGKISIFVAYLLIISRMKDIQRVFQYHGAEHKVVNCYEKEGKVSTKNAKKYSTIHKRCGTTFILLVLIISIIIYLFIPIQLSFTSKLALRIMLLPLIAGISYEILKLNSKYENILLKIFAAPGLWLQKITTNEPDEEQIDVAVFALKKAITFK